MVELFLEGLSQYFGLDWLALICGICGTWMITQKKASGFLLSGLSCCCGFAVAAISMQFGFVFYNLILLCLMFKGFRDWSKAPVIIP